MTLRRALGSVVDAIYPPRCPLCGAGIAVHGSLCPACWNGLSFPAEPACGTCQRPITVHLGPGGLCGACLAKPPRHDGIVAGTLYNATSRALVLQFKHSGRIALAPLLARMMTARLQGVDEHWLVVPVPLHRWRLMRRGYNQAALLAREIARRTGGRLVVDGLWRVRRTPSLGDLGRKERARVLSGAIAVNRRRKASLKGARVLLVDDVLTSGATTDACTRMLKRAGAATVRIACFARVPQEGLERP